MLVIKSSRSLFDSLVEAIKSVHSYEVPEVIAQLVDVYVETRHADERFIDTVRRVGLAPFKERVYAAAH